MDIGSFPRRTARDGLVVRTVILVEGRIKALQSQALTR